MKKLVVITFSWAKSRDYNNIFDPDVIWTHKLQKHNTPKLSNFFTKWNSKSTNFQQTQHTE